MDSFDRELVKRALAEDIGSGDATSLALIPTSTTARAAILAREPLTVAGLAQTEMCFSEIDDTIKFDRTTEDGQSLEAEAILLRLEGPAQSILASERTALNFLQRLSGIATITTQYREAIEDTGAQLLDTRKTTPGWRTLEKHAVACGGGTNHRMGLHDMVLIKENHIRAAGGVKHKRCVLTCAHASTRPTVFLVRCSLAQHATQAGHRLARESAGNVAG